MSGRILVSLAAILSLALHSVHVSALNQCVPEPAVIGSPTTGTAFFAEGFEKNINNVTYPSGFSWHKGNRTGMVAEGHSDNGALQFRFPAGKNGMSEQRFSIGGAYPELWFRYWIKVPVNWRHGSGNTNNKFFAIWMDEYERKGATGVIQTRDSNGNSVISPYVRTRDNRHLGEQTGKMFIDVSRDRGRWMQVVIHVKMASGPSNPNGLFALYRRWEGETDFETIFEYNDWDNYHVGGNQGFAHGYLMGWANATQSEDTEWLLDDFEVSEQSLLSSGTSEVVSQPRPAPATPASPPKILPPKG